MHRAGEEPELNQGGAEGSVEQEQEEEEEVTARGHRRSKTTGTPAPVACSVPGCCLRMRKGDAGVKYSNLRYRCVAGALHFRVTDSLHCRLTHSLQYLHAAHAGRHAGRRRRPLATAVVRLTCRYRVSVASSLPPLALGATSALGCTTSAHLTRDGAPAPRCCASW